MLVKLQGKWLRRGIGVTILLTAVTVVGPAVFNLQSANAIVNTPVFSVHSPISGTVVEFNAAAGQAVSIDQPLGRVLNLRARESLENELQTLQERLDGLKRQQADWLQLQQEFARRAKRHSEHGLARLEEQLAEVASLAQAQRAQVRQDSDTLARQERLAQEGFISPLQIDVARNALQASQARLDAILAREKILRVERQALGDQIYLGDGRNDVPYTRQKQEDLRIQLTELQTRLRETQSRVDQIRVQLAQGASSQQAWQEAPIQSPVAGLLWRKFSANGSEVIAGAELAQVIHCGDAFVDAAVPESQLSHMTPGTPVKYRLLGTDAWREGKVRATSGSGSNGADPTLAAQLPRERKEGRVLVDIAQDGWSDPEAHLCYAGRMVDLTMPRRWSPRALLSRMTALAGT